MKLYLAQHGEACAKEVNAERPLSEKGEADIERLANFLKHASILVGRVMHSGKLRARQTAELLANAIAPDVELEISEGINPNDEPRAFNADDICKYRDTLVVGHLPFLARLVSRLIAADEDALIASFQPGCIVCLEKQDNNQWTLNWMISPELLL